jgi:hypothetical protein
MLREKYKENQYELPKDVRLPKGFSPSNKIRIPQAEFQKLAVAYESFADTQANIK